MNRCQKRVRHLEAVILDFLQAWDDSEMSNRDEAIERMRRLMEQI